MFASVFVKGLHVWSFRTCLRGLRVKIAHMVLRFFRRLRGAEVLACLVVYKEFTFVAAKFCVGLPCMNLRAGSVSVLVKV